MIESISGAKRYRVSPTNPFVVQIQEKHRGRWTLYHACQSAADATQLVLDKGRDVKGANAPQDAKNKG